jgi:hypothetical protein
MYDAEIREFLKKEFIDCLFVDEVVVGKARVDLLDLSEELHGYEIKSDHDSYERLENQVRQYNRYLSKVTIVVGYTKLYEIKSLVPDFWGIITVYKSPTGKPVYELIREAYPNPYFDKKYALSVLWRKELIGTLCSRHKVSKAGRYSKLRRWKLTDTLQKEVSPKQAVDIIRSCFLDRLKEGWRDLGSTKEEED